MSHVLEEECFVFSETSIAQSFCVPLHEFALLSQPDKVVHSLPRELGQELL